MRKIHMTGPEHYAESQRLLSRADHCEPYASAALAAMAQGHAALAKIESRDDEPLSYVDAPEHESYQAIYTWKPVEMAHDSLGKTIPIDGTTATEWTRALLGEAQS